ncbi:hypothetical protein LAV73_09330 [Lysinibacillus xylanilyticus]|uniref:hypothetical protein n=1 Tax=Lysinibacillus xylanilyticus TaxID=582475 RepID=UPI002B24E1E7|nr:hypothetical protein [Lysinibacillus xylanilyticus]MEB2280195.1 hypothetical protein [Lysinibacillus xylanilyticus]
MEKKSKVKISDIYPIEKLNIKKALSFLNIPEYTKFELLKEYLEPKYFDSKLPKGIFDVVIAPHACERWNTRVGPITTNNVITNIFKVAVFTKPNRIQVLEKGLAILDEEYVFSFEFANAILTITTFYGRISLVPMLSNVDILRRYNLQFNEQVKLNIDINVLAQQELPYTPTSVIEFEDKENRTHLLFYFRSKVKNKDFYYHLMPEERDGWDIKIIDLANAHRFILSDIQLHLMGLLGHNFFLLKYMSHLDPERLKNLHETHSKTAIRRFAGNIDTKFLYQRGIL